MSKFKLGVAGYAGAGKDTVVDYLKVQYGYERLAFADPLREFVSAVNPIIVQTVDYARLTRWAYEDLPYIAPELLAERLLRVVQDNIVTYRYNDIIAQVGYRDAKDLYPEVRELLQRVGTEGARETFWDSFWVDLAMRRADDAQADRVAFSDCRFPNEAAACDATVWVSRAGVGPANAHASDNSLDDWDFDYVITNDGSYDDLYELVDEMVQKLEPTGV